MKNIIFKFELFADAAIKATGTLQNVMFLNIAWTWVSYATVHELSQIVFQLLIWAARKDCRTMPLRFKMYIIVINKNTNSKINLYIIQIWKIDKLWFFFSKKLVLNKQYIINLAKEV